MDFDSFDTSWFSGQDFAIDDIGLDDSNYSDLEGFDFTDDGGSWWDSFLGDSGSGGGWMGLLGSGISSYLGGQQDRSRGRQNQQYSLEQIREQGRQSQDLLRLREQLDEEEYQRRQQEIKDAYSQYSNMPGQNQNPMSLLSNFSLPTGRPNQPGATYRGY